MRFTFIAKHRGIWPVAWLCEALDVSRSGFHACSLTARDERFICQVSVACGPRSASVYYGLTLVEGGAKDMRPADPILAERRRRVGEDY